MNRSTVLSPVIEPIESRKMFAGGALDTTFGTAGTALVSFKAAAHETANVEKIVSDAGGRSYLVATTGVSFGARTTLQIRRLTAAGVLDGTWATSKSSNVLFPLSTEQDVHGIPQFDALVDSNNRLVLMLGNHLYRFNINGTLDGTFGSKGIATAAGMTASAALQADSVGHLYVFGTNVGTSTSTAALDRFTDNGVLDTTFSKDGRETVTGYAPSGSSNVEQYAATMRVLQNNSVMLLAGASYDTTSDLSTHVGIQAIRLTAQGVGDSKYGIRGQVVLFGSSTQGATDKYLPAGINGYGSVVLVHGTGDEQHSDEVNVIFAADGSNRSPVELGQDSSVVIGPSAITDRPADFLLQADGSELVVNNLDGPNLFKLQGANLYDTTFNTGNPVSGVAAASLQDDGSVLTAAQLSTRNVITVKRIFRDDAPLAVIAAKPLTTPGTLKFSVVYRGPTAVMASSITGNELRVVGTSGKYVRPRLINQTTLADGSIVANYRTTDLTADTFSASDNGRYALRLLASFVQDAGGTFVPKQTLGDLTVAIV